MSQKHMKRILEVAVLNIVVVAVSQLCEAGYQLPATLPPIPAN